MILDKFESFFTVADSETLGGVASGNSDYRDGGIAGALDSHNKIYLNIVGIENLAGGTSPTLTISLKSGSDGVTFGTTNYTTSAIAAASVAGTRIHIPIPEGIGKAYRIEWAVTSTPTGGGTFKAFLSNS